jgi:hypothetical protein
MYTLRNRNTCKECFLVEDLKSLSNIEYDTTKNHGKATRISVFLTLLALPSQNILSIYTDKITDSKCVNV